jgi:hypothetical protein
VTGTVYTNIVGTQNARQYAMTQAEVGTVLASLGVVTSTVLASTLANYVTTATLAATLATFPALGANNTWTGTNTFGAPVLFSSVATFNAVASLSGGFVVPSGSTGVFGGPEPWCDAVFFGMSVLLPDNSGPLQAAVNYMNTNFAGGNIRIPRGDFSFTNPVTLAGACMLLGNGRTQTFLDASTTDTNVLDFGTLCADGCGLQSLAVLGYVGTIASHNTVIVGQSIPVTFKDSDIWFGSTGLNMAGTDGLIEDCSIQGYKYDVFSTGANWWLRCAFDDSICASAAFHQDMAFSGSNSSENHFTDCDISTAALHSIDINDGSVSPRAITVLNGCVFSKNINIVSAEATMISTGEIGSNISVAAGGGVVILTGNYAFNSITVTGGTSVVKSGNYNIA